MEHGTKELSSLLPVAAIKAALLFAGDQDVRGYLNGVCVEHSPRGLRLVATDGHRMIVYNVDGAECTEDTIRFVIARDVLKAALKLVPKRGDSIVCTWKQTRSPDPERPGVTVIGSAVVTVGEITTQDLQDHLGKFPDIERVIPREVTGEVAQYDVEYLAEAKKAAILLGNRFISVGYNGTSPALINLSANAFAIVMPRRGDAPSDIRLPEWYAPTLKTVKEPKVKAAA